MNNINIIRLEFDSHFVCRGAFSSLTVLENNIMYKYVSIAFYSVTIALRNILRILQTQLNTNRGTLHEINLYRKIFL